MYLCDLQLRCKQVCSVRTVEHMSAAFLFWILNSALKGIYSVLRKEKLQWKE